VTLLFFLDKNKKSKPNEPIIMATKVCAVCTMNGNNMAGL
jgi:hypothetical protein